MRYVWYSLASALVVVACHESADIRTSEAGSETTALYGDPIHSLQMKARPLQEVAPAEGPLWVEVTIRNIADSVVQFLPMFNIGGSMLAEIIGPTGQPVPMTASIDPPNARPVLLQPGELFTDTMDLLCDVPERARTGCLAPYELTQPGEYDIRLRFTLPCNIRPCGDEVILEAHPFTVRLK